MVMVPSVSSRALLQLQPNQHPFWSISFSGAGHLLAYHLGVARRLLDTQQRQQQQQKEEVDHNDTHDDILSIRAVAGSSSGAIAATVFSMFPHRLDEFTDHFLRDGGRALSRLKTMILEDDDASTTISSTMVTNQNRKPARSPPSMMLLGVGTTNCKDGSLHLFTFESASNGSAEDTNTTALHPPLPSQRLLDKSRLIRAIEASCTIPTSFHPLDMFQSSSSVLSYPDHEGIEIDGEYFVDGGIAAPAPPSPLDLDPLSRRIVVSPISRSSSSSTTTTSPSSTRMMMICPLDTTFALPGGDWTTRCGTFSIRPSVQNLRAMMASAGVAPPGVLREWHQRGMKDTERFLDEVRSCPIHHPTNSVGR
jgi:predicted acylesterase/phospholipase RssA